MVQLNIRPSATFFGTFKQPQTTELTIKRLETNLNYFSGNYLIIFITSILLSATPIGRIAFILAVLLIVAHAVFKTRSIKSKANLIWQKHK